MLGFRAVGFEVSKRLRRGTGLVKIENEMDIEEDIPREDHRIWALDPVFSYI